MSNHIETANPIKGLQPRSARAVQLIKTADTCRNCSNSYQLQQVANQRKHNHACNMHNCTISLLEWCKNHKRAN